jgi:hypothetical protein
VVVVSDGRLALVSYFRLLVAGRSLVINIHALFFVVVVRFGLVVVTVSFVDVGLNIIFNRLVQKCEEKFQRLGDTGARCAFGTMQKCLLQAEHSISLSGLEFSVPCIDTNLHHA